MGHDNLAITIFGSTGDLSKKKLFPSLQRLFSEGKLSNSTLIIAYGRRDMSSGDFRDYLSKTNTYENEFLNHIEYVKGGFDDLSTLKSFLDGHDKKNEVISNKLFHLAIPPELYKALISHLGNQFSQTDASWVRVIIEKPFGEDLNSAIDLNSQIEKYFKEEQIYRIDHYLGKETVQNIFVFRFANVLENLWSNKYIESITIRAKETIGIEDRADYYDKAGALRDVVQNHILQLLSIITMDRPEKLDGKSISSKKTEILQNLELIENVGKQCVRGQYQSYREEPNIPKDSNTETYVALKTYINTPRWKNVPILMEAGKKLDKKITEIEIKFMDCCSDLFNQENLEPNKITIQIQPQEEITLNLFVKFNGYGYNLENRKMLYNHHSTDFDTAYSNLIYDCILADKTNFPSIDEILASWKFITNILDYWEKNPDPSFPNYNDGSRGPIDDQSLLWHQSSDNK